MNTPPPQERGIYSASRQDVSGRASCLGRFDMLTFKRTQVRAPSARGIYSASTRKISSSQEFLPRPETLIPAVGVATARRHFLHQQSTINSHPINHFSDF